MKNNFNNFSIKENKNFWGKTTGYHADFNEIEVGLGIAFLTGAAGYFIIKKIMKVGEKR